MLRKNPVTVRINSVTLGRRDGQISYQGIEITGTPAEVDKALAAIFRSGVTRLTQVAHLDTPAPSAVSALGSLYGRETPTPAAL